MSLQRVDIILPPSIVNKFIVILKPLVETTPEEKKTNEIESARPLLRCDNFDNKSLPLIYLEFKGMNLMIPTWPEADKKLHHNLLMIQVLNFPVFSIEKFHFRIRFFFISLM